MKRGFLTSKLSEKDVDASASTSSKNNVAADATRPLTSSSSSSSSSISKALIAPVVPPLPSSRFPTSPSPSTPYWSFHPSSSEAELAILTPHETIQALQSSSPGFNSLSTPSTISSDSSLSYEMRLTPQKGLGLYATQDLGPDSLVLIDRPLLIVDSIRSPLASFSQRSSFDRVLQHVLSQLSFSAQTQFLELYNAFSASEGIYLGKLQTNSHPIISFEDLAAATEPISSLGLFPKYARMNHACDANTLPRWDSKKFVLQVRTTRVVKKGEELTACYIVPFQKRRERRNELMTKWRFNCECGWCSLDDEASARKDEEREKMAEMFLKQWNAQNGER